MPGPSDAAWLRAELAHDKAKRKWVPYKGDPERQCTATSRTGKRCKAHRFKRQDGLLAPTCLYHGGGDIPLETRVRHLRGLVRWNEARLAGARAKLAELELELERSRDMADNRVEASASGPERL